MRANVAIASNFHIPATPPKPSFLMMRQHKVFNFIFNCTTFTALGNLGSVLSAQGRFEEAEEVLLGALKHRPNMADVHYNL